MVLTFRGYCYNNYAWSWPRSDKSVLDLKISKDPDLVYSVQV